MIFDRDTTAFRRGIDAGTFACGLAAVTLLFVEFGFRLTTASQARVVLTIRGVLWLIVILQFLRAVLAADWKRQRWRILPPLLANGSLLLALALEPIVLPWLAAHWPTLPLPRWRMLYLTTLHLTALGVVAHRLLRFNQLLAFVRVSPRVILIGSYLVLIGVGALLLELPKATTAPLAWIDALFTSTSAVCVTGLIVVDTATAFTPTGQAIVMVLFQLGGLGLMTFTYFFVSIFGSGITIRDRALLLEFLNEEYVGRVTGALTAIILMTLAFEAVGAVLLQLSLDTAGPHAWFSSLFHSISAFCNAGFSTYTANLYDPATRTNLPYQLVIMALIVIGGLGFPVLKNLWDCWTDPLRRTRDRPPQRLTTHSKLVLVTTVALIFGGAILIGLIELPAAFPDDTAPRWFSALFTSVTARTAGFNTVPIEALLSPTVFLLLFLMFVGGSPASTAGGIKTTTFAVALLNTVRTLRDASQDLVAFRRKIPPAVANRAFAVVLLAIGWLTASTVVLAFLMPEYDPLDVAFESVSAFCTVGLSRGLTAQLPTTGKLVIIASMLVGRIGILYVALGVLQKERPGRISYPEGNVIIS